MVDDQDIQSQSIKKYDHKSEVCGPVFREGNLFIKLKIPKNEEEGMKEDQKYNGFQELDQMNNNKRVCRFCSKVFSSGKALGGHMRIHVQANKDLVFKKKLKVYPSVKFKKHKYDLPEDEDRVIDFVKKKHYEGCNIKKQTCMICHKHFPSEKSLFGHMRCHPERDWRGIHPPTMATNISCSSSAETQEMDDDRIDLTKSLKGWSVTAKRGRKAVVASSSEISSLEDDQLRDAVNDLMMLAHGDSHESGLTNRHKVDESDAANSTSLMNSKAGIRDISPVSKFKKQTIDEMGSSNFENLECSQVIKSAVDADEATDVLGTGLIFEKPVIEFEQEDSTDDRNNCLETSYANVTIKNKKRRKKVKLSDLEVVQNASPKLADKYYHCSTCDRSFPTHQALGGHRSSHRKFKIWVDEEISNPKIQLADETKESEASNICRRVLDFDLNEVPLPEDETGIETGLVSIY